MFRFIWSKTLRDYRVPMLCWGLGLALLMFTAFATATPVILATYASVAPDFRFLLDPYALLTPQGYATGRYLEAVAPILFSIWPILVGARLLRGEEERGTLDILLATPQGRTRIILEKLLALLAALLVIALLMTLGTLAGEAKIGAQIDPGRAMLAALNLLLLIFFFAMVALLISQFTQNRAPAAGWAAGVMILAFLCDGTGRVVSGFWVQYLSPFYYYNLNRPLIPSFNDTPAAALLLIGSDLLLALVSIRLFVRRDSGRPAFTWQRQQAVSKQASERSLKQAEHDISVRSVALRALSTQSRSAFWWLLAIVAWCGWLVALIPSLQQPLAKALAQAPNLARLFSGANVSTNEGFLGELVFAFVPAIVTIFALTLALAWPADLENGRLELLLGTPRSRTRMALERFGAIFLLILLAPLLSWLAIMVGASIVNLSVDQGHIIVASLSMLPPALLIMGLVYALAGRLRYSIVLGLTTLYIALAFLVEFLKDLLSLPAWLVSLSIFHLYGNPVANGIDWGAFLGMTATAIVLLALGLVQFRYADIERG